MEGTLYEKKIREHACDGISNIVIFDSIDSTNSYGKNYLLEGNPSPAIILAEKQTDGRGRCGRDFYSPRGSGLYMSILYTRDNYSDDALFSTVASRVACALAIEELSGRPVQIKWVNDLYMDGKKAGGILCESVFTGGIMGVVIGIGINVSTTEFPEFDNNVPTCTGELDRNALAGKIYAYFISLASKREKCLAEYRKRFYLKDKEIFIYRANGSTEPAVALGEDDNGGLIVEIDGKCEIIRTGEVTIREK